MSRTTIFAMIRGNVQVATVVTLPNGRCVVSWPTNTIIYDSEQDARNVHIKHMGGRGEPTGFSVVSSTSQDFNEGSAWAQMDHWENAPFASVGGNPDSLSIPEGLKAGRNEAELIAGYKAQAAYLYGEEWQQRFRELAP